MIRHYSLIDGAMVYDVLCASPLFTGPTLNWYVTLLPGEQRRLAGPILIDMDLLETEDAATQLAVEEVLNGFPGRLHVSQLQSERDLTALAHHLQRFTCFYDEDFLLLGLRFADTRILMHLPHVLTPQQWCEMTGPIQQWTLLDRRGDEVVLALPEERAGAISESKQFKLNAEQLEILTDATEPDILLDTLHYTPPMMENQLYDYWHLAQQCVQIWQQSGCRDRKVLRKFAIKIFNSNGQALQEQDWLTVLSQATQQDMLALYGF